MMVHGKVEANGGSVEGIGEGVGEEQLCGRTRVVTWCKSGGCAEDGEFANLYQAVHL